MDKLLPKDKSFFGGGSFNDDESLEWVHRDGGTFLVPAKKQSRISSFRKWEQAFRVFAMIYCGKNPHRAHEIWQYISVINTAASSFIWDNIYQYDVKFRQLMQFNPSRSWAITYNHMWNLTMRDPLPARFNNKGFNGNNMSSNSGNSSKYGQKTHTQGSSRKSGKPTYCWNFNKGLKCKFGAKCRFVERCSYCDSPTHGIIACPKLDKKDKEVLMKKS